MQNNALKVGNGGKPSPIVLQYRKRREVPIAPYIFIAPAVLIFVFFIIWPALQGFYQALFTRGIIVRQDIASLRPVFVGLANFSRLFSDERFIDALLRTIVYSVCTVPLMMSTALMLALLLRRAFTGVGIARAFVYWPAMISPIIIGIAWKWILGYETGILNYLGRMMGLEPVPWLIQPVIAFMAVIFASVWAQAGFFMVIFIGGLNNIPDSFYEAASIDGADRQQQFFRITLPMLRPVTLLVLVLSTIQAFKVYQQVTVLTAGGPGRATVFLVQNIYEEAFKHPNGVGYASAQSVLFFLIMLVLSLLQLRLSKEE